MLDQGVYTPFSNLDESNTFSGLHEHMVHAGQAVVFLYFQTGNKVLVCCAIARGYFAVAFCLQHTNKPTFQDHQHITTCTSSIEQVILSRR